MTVPPAGSRTCPQCGGLNFGDLSRCILCGRAMSTPATAVAFCGECGAQLEPGLRFCGECGTPVTATGVAPAVTPARELPPVNRPTRESPPPTRGRSEAESRWAPPAPDKRAAPGQGTATSSSPKPGVQTAKKFCRGCGTQLKPGSRFCRRCGKDSQAAASDAPAQPKARPVAKRPPAPALPPPTPPKALPAGPGLVKKGLKIVVPVGSMVATYFLTNKVFGPMLAQQFGDASRQMVPMLVSMAVGGVARQITK